MKRGCNRDLTAPHPNPEHLSHNTKGGGNQNWVYDETTGQLRDNVVGEGHGTVCLEVVGSGAEQAPVMKECKDGNPAQEWRFKLPPVDH